MQTPVIQFDHNLYETMLPLTASLAVPAGVSSAASATSSSKRRKKRGGSGKKAANASLSEAATARAPADELAPAPISVPVFVSRAATVESLTRRLRSRPTPEELLLRHVIPGPWHAAASSAPAPASVSAHVDPALQAARRELVWRQTVDALHRRLRDRASVEELVRRGVLSDRHLLLGTEAAGGGGNSGGGAGGPDDDSDVASTAATTAADNGGKRAAEPGISGGVGERRASSGEPADLAGAASAEITEEALRAAAAAAAALSLTGGRPGARSSRLRPLAAGGGAAAADAIISNGVSPDASPRVAAMLNPSSGRPGSPPALPSVAASSAAASGTASASTGPGRGGRGNGGGERASAASSFSSAGSGSQVGESSADGSARTPKHKRHRKAKDPSAAQLALLQQIQVQHAAELALVQAQAQAEARADAVSAAAPGAGFITDAGMGAMQAIGSGGRDRMASPAPAERAHELAAKLQSRPSLQTLLQSQLLKDVMMWTNIDLTTSSLPLPRNCHTLTLAGRCLYLIGGYSHPEPECACGPFVLDVDDSAWHQPPVLPARGDALPCARYAHSTVCLPELAPPAGEAAAAATAGAASAPAAGILAVFGGYGGGAWLNDVWLLDTHAAAGAVAGTALGDLFSLPRQLLRTPGGAPAGLPTPSASGAVQWHQPPIVGAPPPPRAAHSAVIMELPPAPAAGLRASPAMVVFGGNDGLRLHADTWLLRLQPEPSHLISSTTPSAARPALQWLQPQTVGSPPSPRSGHSAVSLCIEGVWQMIIFGGGEGWGNECYNDLHLMQVVAQAPALSGAESATGDAAGMSLGASPSASVAAAPAAAATEVGAAAGAGGGTAVAQSVQAGAVAPYACVWLRPSFSGLPPSPRTGHTGCLVHGSGVESAASRRSPKMLVFGGGDAKRALNDLHVLDIATWTWSRPSDTGAVPRPRAGAAAAALGCFMVMFGGATPDSTCFQDLSVLDTEWTYYQVAGAGPLAAASSASDAPAAAAGSTLAEAADDEPVVLAPARSAARSAPAATLACAASAFAALPPASDAGAAGAAGAMSSPPRRSRAAHATGMLSLALGTSPAPLFAAAASPPLQLTTPELGVTSAASPAAMPRAAGGGAGLASGEAGGGGVVAVVTPQQLRSILETRLSEDNRRFEAMLRTLVAWREERESSTRELLERLG